MGWLMRNTKDPSNTLSQCRCIGWIVPSVAGDDKNVRMRAYGEVLSVHSTVAFMTVATVDAKSVREKKLHGWWMCKTAKGIRTQVDFGNSRNSVRPRQVSLSWFEHESVVFRSYHLSHHSWSCHSSGCHSLHCSESFSCWELHHVELSVHVEDEDDEKCCCQLELNRSKCFWTVGSNVLCCLLLKCNGTWGTPLPWSRWRLTRASADGL